MAQNVKLRTRTRFALRIQVYRFHKVDAAGSYAGLASTRPKGRALSFLGFAKLVMPRLGPAQSGPGAIGSRL